MAREPQTSTANSGNAEAPKQKRKGGSRTVKDKVVFLLFKGSIESLSVMFDPLEALDMKEADPTLTYRKITIPVKRPKKPTDPVTATV